MRDHTTAPERSTARPGGTSGIQKGAVRPEGTILPPSLSGKGSFRTRFSCRAASCLSRTSPLSGLSGPFGGGTLSMARSLPERKATKRPGKGRTLQFKGRRKDHGGRPGFRLAGGAGSQLVLQSAGFFPGRRARSAGRARMGRSGRFPTDADASTNGGPYPHLRRFEPGAASIRRSAGTQHRLRSGRGSRSGLAGPPPRAVGSALLLASGLPMPAPI